MTIYTDSFPQADENPLSSGGIWDGGYTTFNNLKVVSKRVRCSVTGDHRATVNSITPADDQYVQIKLPTWNAGATQHIAAILLLRYTAPATTTGYEAVILRLNTGAESIHLTQNIAGVTTELGVGVSITIAANDVFLFTIIGSDMTVYQNTISRYTASDTAITSGRVGMGANINPGGALGDLEIDDFNGGSYDPSQLWVPPYNGQTIGGMVGRSCRGVYG